VWCSDRGAGREAECELDLPHWEPNKWDDGGPMDFFRGVASFFECGGGSSLRRPNQLISQTLILDSRCALFFYLKFLIFKLLFKTIYAI
jgi:hypothetical protein